MNGATYHHANTQTYCCCYCRALLVAWCASVGLFHNQMISYCCCYTVRPARCSSYSSLNRFKASHSDRQPRRVTYYTYSRDWKIYVLLPGYHDSTSNRISQLIWKSIERKSFSLLFFYFKFIILLGDSAQCQDATPRPSLFIAMKILFFFFLFSISSKKKKKKEHNTAVTSLKKIIIIKSALRSSSSSHLDHSGQEWWVQLSWVANCKLLPTIRLLLHR